MNVHTSTARATLTHDSRMSSMSDTWQARYTMSVHKYIPPIIIKART